MRRSTADSDIITNCDIIPTQDMATQTEDYIPGPEVDKTQLILCPAQQPTLLPRLQVKIGNTYLSALVDSGASRNLLRAEFAVTNPGQTSHQHFQLACGTNTVTSHGYAKIPFFVEGTAFLTTFQIIAELNEEMILGSPFLQQEYAVVDFQRKCLHIGKETRQTIYWDQSCQPLQTKNELPSKLNIPEQHETVLKPLLEEFCDIFSNLPTQPTTSTTRHHIQLREHQIIHQRPYPMSPDKKKILYDQVQEMLETGVIEPSSSEYSSPPVIIERHGKKPRFCIDYRRLNAITTDEPSVLPKIHEAIKELGNGQYFTLLDLKSGYWQIPMAEDSKAYTAFSTPDGALYQFRVMPFGLRGAPGTFQRLMTNEVLNGFLHHFTTFYLDDILIYSNTLEDHLKHLRLVFERLRLHQLQASPEKCTFITTQIDYLGHRISGSKTLPQTKHVLAIREFAEPRTRKQLQSFLGTCNWIREYIPNMAELTQSLTKLLNIKEKYTWTKESREAFRKLKDVVSQPLELHRPDFSKQFISQTDASTNGMGAALYQQGVDGERTVISYASATFRPAERKYHINEQECLSCVWAIKRYSHFLSDKPFILQTDNRALIWLNKNKDATAKLTRWSLLLQEYTFTIEHCSGKQNELADFLSRNLQHAEERPDLDEDRLFPPEHDKEGSYPIHAITESSLYQKIITTQRRSANIRTDKLRWQAIHRSGPNNAKERRFYDKYTVYDDVLWCKTPEGDKAVVPKSLIVRVIHQYHDLEAGHPGRDETFRAITSKYFYPGLHKKGRQIQPAAPLKAHTPQNPFEMLSIDILGPYPETRHDTKYIIAVEDVFTRWVEAIAVPNADATAITSFLRELFARYGTPKTIISDNGSSFHSRQYRRLAQTSNIQLFYSAVEHQRANPVERRNQELKKTLSALIYKKPANQWDKFLDQALFNLRTRKNAAIGVTPAKALLGYELPRPGDWEVPQYIQQRRARQSRKAGIRQIRARQLNFQRQYAPEKAQPIVEFAVGDLVMIRKRLNTKGGFIPSWTGPHVVTAKNSPEVYKVDRDGHITLEHVDDLRPAPTGNEIPINETDSDSEPDDELNEDETENSSSEADSQTEDDSSARVPRVQPQGEDHCISGQGPSTQPGPMPHRRQRRRVRFGDK